MQAPSLQNRTKIRSKVPQPTRNSGQKRGEPRKDTEEQGSSRTVADQQPPSKRKKVEDPEEAAEELGPDIQESKAEKEGTAEAKTTKGSNTPVVVKIRRFEEKNTETAASRKL